MSALTFALKSPLQLTLDLSPLTPDRLAGLSKTRIKQLPLRHGKQKVTVGELFTISGDDPENIRLQRGSPKFTHVGMDMSRGSIQIKGYAGDYAGQYMQGGSLRINGEAGAWLGCSMRGGRIEIKGNAGDYLGAGFHGDPHGMSNGLILVQGNAGDRAGDRMRRGIIIIEGSAGDYCGSRMAAGTIIVLEKAGRYSGFGMKRGTIILARKPTHIAATFRSCGDLKMQFLRLLFKQISEMGKEFAAFEKYGPKAHRFAGDLSSQGKGEILVLQR